MSLFADIYTLPLGLLFPHAPGVPIVAGQVPDTLLRLAGRAQQLLPARLGLTTRYTIQNQTGIGYEFLFGPTSTATDDADEKLRLALNTTPLLLTQALHLATKAPLLDPTSLATTAGLAPLAALAGPGAAAGLPTAAPGAQLLAVAGVAASSPAVAPASPLTTLALDDPAQFSISWTTFENLYQQATRPPATSGQPSVLDQYARTLTDADAATAAFWPQLAQEAAAFNLLLVQKVSALPPQFAAATLPAGVAELAAQGLLYAIDLSLFAALTPQQVNGSTRFTPATCTLLTQDPATKALTPVAIWVAGPQQAGAQVYVRGAVAGVATDSAWLYALQAVKASLTVYGIWLGHVYHWHLVTAAMQMTMYNTFQRNTTHPVYQLLAPQSDFLMAFDNVLLAFWDRIAPPTSIGSAHEFLTLIGQFATGRSFFADDPLATLAALGLQASDFTLHTPWDQYPVVQQLLAVWEASQQYVGRVVAVSYPTDAAVQADPLLAQWMAAAGPYAGLDYVLHGNVQDLPAMDSVTSLASVLTSLVYRTTVHGLARLLPLANPSLTFVANFPPCLQSATVPAPTATLSPTELLAYLPNTGTIGEMVTFYYTFSFSVPYEPFIPLAGLEADLYFPEPADGPRNQALVQFRTAIQQFIATYYPYSDCPYSPDQTHQWPLNIET